MTVATKNALTSDEVVFETLLRLGDNTLILSQRLSEWCGKAPILEEDIATANTALDLIGQTINWLGLAAEVENKERTADDLAMLRDAWDFRNVLLVEQPNGDFGQTLMRQYLFDSWHILLLNGLLSSSDERIAAIAEKSLKEVSYHHERSRDLVVRLGDGSAESHARMQNALDLLYPYVGEFFEADAVDLAAHEAGLIPDVAQLRAAYDAELVTMTAEATLVLPESRFAHRGGKTGFRHSEHLGHILTNMQWLQRAYPGAEW